MEIAQKIVTKYGAYHTLSEVYHLLGKQLHDGWPDVAETEKTEIVNILTTALANGLLTGLFLHEEGFYVALETSYWRSEKRKVNFSASTIIRKVRTDEYVDWEYTAVYAGTYHKPEKKIIWLEKSQVEEFFLQLPLEENRRSKCVRWIVERKLENPARIKIDLYKAAQSVRELMLINGKPIPKKEFYRAWKAANSSPHLIEAGIDLTKRGPKTNPIPHNN